jgi:hypothetical protein
VDASVLTAKITNGVPDDVGCPDVVLWYEETGRLGAPGNAVFVGAADWVNAPAVFAELINLEPGDSIEVIGEDGKIYRFLVEELTKYDRAAAPINEIFGETESEKRLTLLTETGDFDYNTGEFTEVLVVVARRTGEKATLPATPVAEASPVPGRDCLV